METTKQSQTARILKLLQEQGYATNTQLNRICFRYAARIHELRKEGHEIKTKRISEGVFHFVYFEKKGWEEKKLSIEPRVNLKNNQLSLLV